MSIKRPSVLTLAGRRVKVLWVRGLKDLDRRGHEAGGDYGQDTIRVALGMTPSGERVTVLHELIHHCAERGKASVSRADEERMIGSIDGWLLLALRENPELVEWLMEEDP